MLKRIWTAFLSTAVLVALAATLFFAMTPQRAQALASGTRYAAGNETSGTHICNYALCDAHADERYSQPVTVFAERHLDGRQRPAR